MKKDEKSKQAEEKLPFIDFFALKSKTVKIILVSTVLSSLGLNTPMIFLVSFYLHEVHTLQNSLNESRFSLSRLN